MKFEVKIQDIVSEQDCFEKVRALRWGNSAVKCPYCNSTSTVKNGGAPCQRYKCKTCDKNFNDLTNTVFSESNLPLKNWIICLYFMGLNLSNRQIAMELDISEKTAQEICSKLRSDVEKKGLSYHLAEKLS